jgi:hypothetical protein
MPKKTYTQITSVTLAVASSSVTFSSIPQNFRDLVLIQSGTSTNTSINSLQIRMNNDSGSNYPGVVMSADSVSASAATFTDSGHIAGFAINVGVVINVVNIMDYSSTDKHKTVLSRHNTATDSRVRAAATRWTNTAAVTSLICRVDTGASWNAGSTFTLYGIEA